MDYNLTLQEALKCAENGDFVTNAYFGEEQSLHMYNGSFYYEDGPVVTEEFLEEQHFAQGTTWSVKYPAVMVNKDKLKDLHDHVKQYMLMESYEACIEKDDISENDSDKIFIERGKMVNRLSKI